MNHDIALVIPVFNESIAIATTLDRFAKEAGQNIVFVVIDNHSTDDTAQVVRSWSKKHSNQPLVIASESKHGSVHARKRGLLLAKKMARVVISTDADCWPLPGFYKDVLSSFQNTSIQVLKGHLRHSPKIRLLKQLFLPELMDLLAWQETLEEHLFGPFFFGGYFGIRSECISADIFNDEQLPIPSGPSPFWGRHCHYQGLAFDVSKPNLRTSSRRMWFDTTNFFSGSRDEPVRDDITSAQVQIKKLQQLHDKQAELVVQRQKYFAERLLLFFLDAVFHRTNIENQTIITNVISRSQRYLSLPNNIVEIISSLRFEKAQSRLVKNHQQQVLKKIVAAYEHK